MVKRIPWNWIALKLSLLITSVSTSKQISYCIYLKVEEL